MFAALHGTATLDLRFKVIPNRFQMAGLLGAIMWVSPELATSPVPILIDRGTAVLLPIFLRLSTFVYELVRRRPGLGYGDIKMFGWISVAFGSLAWEIGFLSLLLGAVTCLILCWRRSWQQTFAYGPFIAGALISYLFIN